MKLIPTTPESFRVAFSLGRYLSGRRYKTMKRYQRWITIYGAREYVQQKANEIHSILRTMKNFKERDAFLRRQFGPPRKEMKHQQKQFFPHIGQEDICPICKELGKMVNDHCHTTGLHRERICFRCNIGLGMFRDNQIYLQGAIEYLNKYPKENYHDVQMGNH